MTIHNLSSHTFNEDELSLLNKGLSFAPTPTSTQQEQLQLLRHYDNYAKTVRRSYTNRVYSRPHNETITQNQPPTAQIYRPMIFLPKQTYSSMTDTYSGFSNVEHYIAQTKQHLDDHILKQNPNISPKERNAVKKLKSARTEITIKPADKNLGIVVLNTDDYVTQCTSLLSDTTTYRQTQEYPREQIKKELTNTLVNFKTHISNYNKKLYDFLLPGHNTQVPQLYGIPKVHKNFKHLPPLRPIVSHCNSQLNPTAKLLDHCLQPLAQAFPDYIQNSTALSLILEDLHVPDDAFLVSIDVESLYPSIPQTECLYTIYEQMHEHRHLLLLNPNLLIRLLHVNVNYNYFNFGMLSFQQIQGTAMGAAFSPTIANIHVNHPTEFSTYSDTETLSSKTIH